MLKIHNNNFKKYRIPLISTFVVIGGMFLFSYLTYIPTQIFAVEETETRTLSDINYMQEMNKIICDNTAVGDTKQLKDVRDSKKYWVAKHKDNRCWMTQNLDLDLDVPLLSSSSNLSEMWSSNEESNLWTNSNFPSNGAKWYDPGDFFWAGDISGSICGDSTAIINCLDYGWGLSGDYHRHIGNYYSWEAATAGGGTKGDICPKNWMLPTDNSSDVSGSWMYLLSSYGLHNSYTDGEEIVFDSPLYVVPAGLVTQSIIDNIGAIGYYWNSRGILQGNTGAYMFEINDNSNLLATHSGGFSVRCIANPNSLTSEVVIPPVAPGPLDSNQANVAITVSPVISIDATSGMSESIDFTQVAEGDITAKVSSNQAYQVLLSTEQSNLEQNPVLANFNIPMVASDTEITAGVNSWGVKKTLSVTTGGTAGDDTTLTNTLYSPIGIGDDKVLFYKSSGAESKTLVFPVAISVDATLPSGIYSTQVTITAVAN